MDSNQQRAARGSPLNAPWQDSAGAWCCPRCQRATFKSRMAVLGHLRTCPVSGMLEPVVLGPATQAPRFSSYQRQPQHEAPPAWFAAEMMRLHSRFDAVEGRTQALERFTGNHLSHARIQLAGAGGAAAPSDSVWGIPTKWLFLGGAVVAGLFVLGVFSRSDTGVAQAKRIGDVAGAGTKLLSAGKTLKGLLG